MASDDAHDDPPPDLEDVFSGPTFRASRTDRGRGSLADYDYALVPRSPLVVLRLAGSDPFQDELARLHALGGDERRAFVEHRWEGDERVDAPTPVRLDVEGELSGVVGFIPIGLEAVAQALLARRARQKRSTLIPSRIVATRRGLRLDLFMGRIPPADP